MNAQTIINIEDRRPKVNPQKEDGYTAIANEIMDEICKLDLSGAQFRILWAVLRRTYGWHKKGDYISVSQLSKMTECSKRSVIYAIQNLEAKKILSVTREVSGAGGKFCNYIAFNKHYDQWVVQTLAPGYKQVVENTAKAKESTTNEVVQTLAPGSAILGKKVVQRFAHTKDNNKRKDLIADSDESATEEIYKSKSGNLLKEKRLLSFNRFWDCFNLKAGKASAADSWLKIPQLTNSMVDQICMAATIEAARRPEIIKKGLTPKWAQGWLTERRWEDEIYQVSDSENQTKREYLNIPGVKIGEEM